jgi:hypothetical protein
LGQRLNAGEPIIKTEIEIDALHLSVRDDVCSGTELIVDGKAHGVPKCLRSVLRPEKFGLAGYILAKLDVPAGE